MTPDAETRIMGALDKLTDAVAGAREGMARMEGKLDLVDQHGRRLDEHGRQLGDLQKWRATISAQRGRFAWGDVGKIIAAVGGVLAIIAALLALQASSATAAPLVDGPNLNDGKVRVYVGRPRANRAAPPRRIYPSGTYARGVTLLKHRASLPRAWDAWEVDRIRIFARKRGWITWMPAGRGFDITPHLTGREYRVHRGLLAGLEASARRRAYTCGIVSGWRDSTNQLRLWLGYIAGLPGFAPANRPGTSKHEALYGLPARAADVYCYGIAFWTYMDRNGLRAYAIRQGLRQPYGHEPWHVESVKAG